MSDKIKIKLNIADRIYPLSIFPDQESSLRASSKKIELMSQQLEKNYAVRDKQDVLAMCALQYAAQLENKFENKFDRDNSFEKINELIDLIDMHLSEY